MKKKKLKLKEINVQSFVTSMEKGEAITMKGGTGNSDNPVCNTAVAACRDTVAAVCPGQGTFGTGIGCQDSKFCTLLIAECGTLTECFSGNITCKTNVILC